MTFVDGVGTLSAVQTASFMLLWLHAIAVILAAPSWTSWMFLMYLPGQRLQRESLSAGEGDEEDKPQLHDLFSDGCFSSSKT